MPVLTRLTIAKHPALIMLGIATVWVSPSHLVAQDATFETSGALPKSATVEVAFDDDRSHILSYVICEYEVGESDWSSSWLKATGTMLGADRVVNQALEEGTNGVFVHVVSPNDAPLTITILDAEERVIASQSGKRSVELKLGEVLVNEKRAPTPLEIPDELRETVETVATRWLSSRSPEDVARAGIVGGDSLTVSPLGLCHIARVLTGQYDVRIEERIDSFATWESEDGVEVWGDLGGEDHDLILRATLGDGKLNRTAFFGEDVPQSWLEDVRLDAFDKQTRLFLETIYRGRVDLAMQFLSPDLRSDEVQSQFADIYQETDHEGYVATRFLKQLSLEPFDGENELDGIRATFRVETEDDLVDEAIVEFLIDTRSAKANATVSSLSIETVSSPAREAARLAERTAAFDEQRASAFAAAESRDVAHRVLSHVLVADDDALFDDLLTEVQETIDRQRLRKILDRTRARYTDIESLGEISAWTVTPVEGERAIVTGQLGDAAEFEVRLEEGRLFGFSLASEDSQLDSYTAIRQRQQAGNKYARRFWQTLLNEGADEMLQAVFDNRWKPPADAAAVFEQQRTAILGFVENAQFTDARTVVARLDRESWTEDSFGYELLQTLHFNGSPLWPASFQYRLDGEGNLSSLNFHFGQFDSVFGSRRSGQAEEVLNKLATLDVESFSEFVVSAGWDTPEPPVLTAFLDQFQLDFGGFKSIREGTHECRYHIHESALFARYAGTAEFENAPLDYEILYVDGGFRDVQLNYANHLLKDFGARITEFEDYIEPHKKLINVLFAGGIEPFAENVSASTRENLLDDVAGWNEYLSDLKGELGEVESIEFLAYRWDESAGLGRFKYRVDGSDSTADVTLGVKYTITVGLIDSLSVTH